MRVNIKFPNIPALIFYSRVNVRRINKPLEVIVKSEHASHKGIMLLNLKMTVSPTNAGKCCHFEVAVSKMS